MSALILQEPAVPAAPAGSKEAAAAAGCVPGAVGNGEEAEVHAAAEAGVGVEDAGRDNTGP